MGSWMVFEKLINIFTIDLLRLVLVLAVLANRATAGLRSRTWFARLRGWTRLASFRSRRLGICPKGANAKAESHYQKDNRDSLHKLVS